MFINRVFKMFAILLKSLKSWEHFKWRKFFSKSHFSFTSWGQSKNSSSGEKKKKRFRLTSDQTHCEDLLLSPFSYSRLNKAPEREIKFHHVGNCIFWYLLKPFLRFLLWWQKILVDISMETEVSETFSEKLSKAILWERCK